MFISPQAKKSDSDELKFFLNVFEYEEKEKKMLKKVHFSWFAIQN